jgi:hypothetical protein
MGPHTVAGTVRCTFVQKARHAQQAGASALLVYDPTARAPAATTAAGEKLTDEEAAVAVPE